MFCVVKSRLDGYWLLVSWPWGVGGSGWRAGRLRAVVGGWAALSALFLEIQDVLFRDAVGAGASCWIQFVGVGELAVLDPFLDGAGRDAQPGRCVLCAVKFHAVAPLPFRELRILRDRVYHKLPERVKSGGGTMNKNNILSEHLWPAIIGALCTLPEIADGKPLWWLVAGAAGCWGSGGNRL
jgi:hypothetical protein